MNYASQVAVASGFQHTAFQAYGRGLPYERQAPSMRPPRSGAPAQGFARAALGVMNIPDLLAYALCVDLRSAEEWFV